MITVFAISETVTRRPASMASTRFLWSFANAAELMRIVWKLGITPVFLVFFIVMVFFPYLCLVPGKPFELYF